MKFFFDNCLAPAIVDALKALGVDVVHLRDELAQHTEDEVWIPHAASRDYISVTDDHQIRRKPAQRELLRVHKLRTVFLAASIAQVPLWEQAAKVIKWWPTIDKWAARSRPGHCKLVTIHGKLEDWRHDD